MLTNIESKYWWHHRYTSHSQKRSVNFTEKIKDKSTYKRKYTKWKDSRKAERALCESTSHKYSENLFYLEKCFSSTHSYVQVGESQIEDRNFQMYFLKDFPFFFLLICAKYIQMKTNREKKWSFYRVLDKQSNC